MRLIDADELKNHKVHSEEFAENVVSVCYIDWQPTIEAEPVKHGHWDERTLCNGDRVYQCSRNKCHAVSIVKHFYCPACGAKMDLDEVKK